MYMHMYMYNAHADMYIQYESKKTSTLLPYPTLPTLPHMLDVNVG